MFFCFFLVKEILLRFTLCFTIHDKIILYNFNFYNVISNDCVDNFFNSSVRKIIVCRCPN